MKIHFNGIKRVENLYEYVYHAQEKRNSKGSFGYFAIAGIIGSFKVVSERGWLYLVPFWMVIFAMSKGVDWLRRKLSDQGNTAEVKFISKYPHYNLGDIHWMLQCTNQDFQLNELVRNASNNWGHELYIEIGRLSAKKIERANFTQKILNEAVMKQSELEQEWSKITGQEYPELGMPKR